MTQDTLVNEYFEWMLNLVCCERYSKNKSYRKLLCRLHDIDFNYSIDRDGNRAEDGVCLRYRFGYERKYPDAIIASSLDDRASSVLEMMVALCQRCEETIMSDLAYGDRTGQWFWDMIDSLGLSDMTDDKFDKLHTDEVIDRFLNQDYKRNGEGGLFTIRNCKTDLRTVEIWCQMMWHLDDILKN